MNLLGFNHENKNMVEVVEYAKENRIRHESALH